MKIAVIGGAGVRTVIFINGLLKRCRKLDIDEVALYDIDRDKLGIIQKLCAHVVSRAGGELRVYAAQDAREAVTGADYVVTTLRVGGDHSRTMDEEIALRCGVIGQETTGVGGFSMAARTIPVLLEYCELIRSCAPNAWIFNFTNPSGLVTQALKSAGYDRVIGICDAPSSAKFRMADYLGVTEEELYVEFFGLNHLSWIRSVKVSGREIMGELLKDSDFLKGVEEFERFDPEVIRLVGLLPNEYLYYYYHREKTLENIVKAGSARGRNIEEINRRMFEELRGMDMDKDPEGALQTFLYYMQLRENSYMAVETGGSGRPILERGQLPIPEGIGYAGVMLDCIEGMQSDTGRYLVLSVENQGALPQLNPEDVVEMTCLVSKEGIRPVSVENPPQDCMLLIHSIKHYERLAVKAIMEGSSREAVRALMLHPLINSYSLAERLVKEYEEAYEGMFKK